MSTLNVNTINAATSGQAVAVDVKNPRSFRNLIINGDQRITQRGTSTTTNAAFAIDRWKHSSNGLGVTITNSQQSLTSSDTPYSYGFRKSNRLALASAGTAGAGNYLQFWYTAEAQDIANSGWNYTSSSSYINLSFWARASSTQTYGCVFETNDGTAYLYPKKFDLTANTWTKISFKVPGNSNLTINDDNGAGLILKIFPYLGTTYSGGTDETWAAASGNGYGSMGNTSTWLTAGASTFDLTGVQLEVGSYATDFEHKSYTDELLKCQRYYYLLAEGNSKCMGLGVMTASSELFTTVHFPVHMRATPSLAATSGTDYYKMLRNNDNDVFTHFDLGGNTTNIVAELTNDDQVGANVNNTGFVRTNNASSHVGFSAEL